MYNIFEAKLQSVIDTYLLSEDHDDVDAVVVVIKHRDKYLIGLNKTNDDRNMKWGFCAGHTKRGEDPADTAVREAREEFGVKVKAVKGPVKVPGRKNVVAFLCRTDSFLKPKVNREFVVAEWFKIKEMKSLKLYVNIMDIINKL